MRKLIRACMLSLLLLGSVETALQIVALWAQTRRSSGANNDGTFRILCIGESTTAPPLYGEDHSWPVQLERILNERYGAKRVSVINRGRIGTNTGFLLAKLPQYLEEDRPNLVVAMLGINDDLWFGIVEQDHWQAFLNHIRLYRLARLVFDRMHQHPKVSMLPETRDQRSLDNDPDALICLESSADGPEAWRSSMAACRKALARSPRSSHLLEKSGELALKLGFEREGVQSLRRSISLDPNFEQGYIALGFYYLSKNNLAEAETLLNSALRMPFSLKNDTPTRMMIEVYRRQGRGEDAQHMFLGKSGWKSQVDVLDAGQPGASVPWPDTSEL